MRKFLGQALAQQSLLFFRKGEFDRAQANLEESLEILRPFHDPRALVDPLIYLGIILHLNGELDRSQSLLEEGLAYTQAEEDEWFRAFFLANLGYVAGLRNCHQEAYEQMQAALKIWRRLGDPHSIGMGINFMSPTLMKLGYYAEAESALQESISLAVQSGNRWGMGTAYRFLGLVKLAEGQYAEAQAHLRKSLDVFGDFFVGWDIARTLTYLGETALKMGDVDQGRKTYLIALGTALEAGAMPIAADAMLGLAEILLQSGEAGDAFKLALHVMQNEAAVEETRAAATRLAVVAESHLQESEIRGLTESVNGLSLQELAESMFPAA